MFRKPAVFSDNSCAREGTLPALYCRWVSRNVVRSWARSRPGTTRSATVGWRTVRFTLSGGMVRDEWTSRNDAGRDRSGDRAVRCTSRGGRDRSRRRRAEGVVDGRGRREGQRSTRTRPPRPQVERGVRPQGHGQGRPQRPRHLRRHPPDDRREGVHREDRGRRRRPRPHDGVRRERRRRRRDREREAERGRHLREGRRHPPRPPRRHGLAGRRRSSPCACPAARTSPSSRAASTSPRSSSTTPC